MRADFRSRGAVGQKAAFGIAAGNALVFRVPAVKSIGFPHDAAAENVGIAHVHAFFHGDQGFPRRRHAFFQGLLQAVGQGRGRAEGRVQVVSDIIAVLRAQGRQFTFSHILDGLRAFGLDLPGEKAQYHHQQDSNG